MKYLKHSIENLLNNVVEHRTSPRISTFTVLNLFCLHIAEQRPLEGSPAVVTPCDPSHYYLCCTTISSPQFSLVEFNTTNKSKHMEWNGLFIGLHNMV